MAAAVPQRLDWIFALRTTAAGLVALFVALAMGLEEPQWAIMTVFIIAQPLTGMVLAKGFYRVVGTAVGATVGVGLVNLCQGQAAIFVLAMALWLSVCTFVSGLLRENRSYGAVLAGYTAGVVAYPAFGSPGMVEELGRARFTEILLGLVCGGIASALVLPQRVRPMLHLRLRACLVELARYSAGALRGEDAGKLDELHRRLIQNSQALDVLRAYAVVEAPVFRRRNRMVRRLIGDVLSAMSSARTIRAHILPDETPLRPLLLQIADAFEAIAGQGMALDQPGPWLEPLRTVEAAIATRQAALQGGSGADVAAAVLLAALSELVDATMHALIGFGAFSSGRGRPLATDRPKSAPLAVHRSPRLAFRNSVRTGIVVVALSVFWRVSGWEAGSGIVAVVAAISALFGTKINAYELSIAFLRGTILAVPLAFVIGELLLPHLPGAGWVLAAVTPVLVAAGLAMVRPRFVVLATGFAVMFLVMLNPRAVMVYDPEGFAMLTAVVLVGLGVCSVVLKFVMPPSPQDEVRQLLGAIRADVSRLCTRADIPAKLVFESRMYDRINQLLPRLDLSGLPTDAVLDGSLAALTLGLEILRLRDRRADRPFSPTEQALLDGLLARLSVLLVEPSGNAAAVNLACAMRAAALSLATDPVQAAANRLPEAAALRLMAAALADHAAFFANDAEPPPAIAA